VAGVKRGGKWRQLSLAQAAQYQKRSMEAHGTQLLAASRISCMAGVHA